MSKKGNTKSTPATRSSADSSAEQIAAIDDTPIRGGGVRLETIIRCEPEPRIVDVPNEAHAPIAPPDTASSEPSQLHASSASDSSTVRATFEIHEPIGSLRETLQTPCPVREPLVEGLIDRGQIIVFGAKPGTGKTPVVTQLLSAKACGVTFLGYSIPKPCRVALIDLENSPGMQRAILQQQWQAMGLDQALVQDNMDAFVCGNPHDPNSRELDRILTASASDKLQWLGSLARTRAYDLIFIDTILAFVGLKSTDEIQIRAMFRELRAIRSTPPFPAIGLTIHLRKGSERGRDEEVTLLDNPRQWTEEFLGSGVWSASADVRLGMEPYGAQELHKVFSGFRRVDGELTPHLIEQEFTEIEGVLIPRRWVQIDAGLALERQLTPTEGEHWARICLSVPVGQSVKFAALVDLCKSKSVASRLLRKAQATGVLSKNGDGWHRKV